MIIPPTPLCATGDNAVRVLSPRRVDSPGSLEENRARLFIPNLLLFASEFSFPCTTVRGRYHSIKERHLFNSATGTHSPYLICPFLSEAHPLLSYQVLPVSLKPPPLNDQGEEEEIWS